MCRLISRSKNEFFFKWKARNIRAFHLMVQFVSFEKSFKNELERTYII